MKRILFAISALGLLGCFLPFVLGVSWFEMRHLMPGMTVWWVIAAFAVPTFIGATSGELDKADAIAATTAYGYLAYKFNIDAFRMLVQTSIGGIMMGVAMICGFVVAGLSLVAAVNKR
jgi:hypothetical protein